MTDLATSEQEHIDGLLQALRGFNAAAYERGRLPDVPDPAYCEVEITRLPGGNFRAGGPGPTFGLFQITERASSKDPVALRRNRDAVAAIEGETFDVADFTTTPVMFDGADPISPEDGLYVGFRTWTYALFPSAS